MKVSNRFTSRNCNRVLVPAALAVSLAIPGLLSAQVAVQQVESSIAAGIPAYAPIEFGGSSSVTGSLVGFPGVTLFAQGPTTNTYSIHADFTADNFFGPGSIGHGAIHQAFIVPAVLFDSLGQETSTPFFTDTLRFSNSVVGPVPNPIGNNIRVSNHSYVYQFPTAVQNTEILRRADFLIARDNVVWTAGAVTGAQFVGGTGETTLGWQPRNGIAVRGDAGQTPFNPALGRPGRQHADVWMSGLASFTAPQVGGIAAQIIRQSQIDTNTAMGDARVVKSVIMTGADKVTRPGFNVSPTPAWNPTTANNLDAQGGAGRANLAGAMAIINAGQRTMVGSTGTVSGSLLTAGNVPSLVRQGWALETIPASAAGASTVLVHVNGAINSMSATLNWFWTSATTGGGANIDTSDAALIAPDLSLELRRVTWNGTQYVLGLPIGNVAGRDLDSDSTGATADNVEHIFLTTGSLAPGTYAFLIRGGSAATTAAFSYNIGTAATAQWNLPGGGTYGVGGNWIGGHAPNAVSTTAIFGTSITAPSTVTLGSAVTLGSISFTGSHAYTLGFVAGFPTTLTLSNGAFGPAQIAVATAGHTINNPVVNFQGATVSFSAAPASLRLVAALQNTGPLVVNNTLAGPGGTLEVAASVVGTGSVTVNQARLVLSNPGSATVNNVLLTQDLSIGGTAAARGTVALTGAVVPASGPRGVLPTMITPASLAIAHDGAPLGSRVYFGVLDLGGNDAIFPGGSLADLTDMARAFLAGQGGIGSTLSGTAGVNQFTGIAIVSPINPNSGFPDFDTFNGVPVGPTDIIAKYTYLGDTNLDGRLDAIDFNTLLNGFTNGLTGWQNGDTNYDGVVNWLDYGNLLNAMASQGGTVLGQPPSLVGVIPEPAALGLLLAGAPMLLRRRRA